MIKAYKYLVALFFLLMIFNQTIEAQNISFVASAPKSVAVGEQFIVQYTINSSGLDFSGPSFENFRALSGPNLSTNSSYQYINGKMSQSVSNVYTYYLRALKEGNFKIGEATIRIGTQTYSSNDLTVAVSSKPKNQQSSSPTRNTQNQNQQTVAPDDLYIKAIVDKRNPYLGEQIILTYKIYTTVPIAQISAKKESNLQGFWMKNLMEEGNQLQQSREIINGKEYVVAEIRKFALFPQKTGKIVIDEFELECVAQLKQATNNRRSNSVFDSFFDDPFFGRTRNIQKFLTTEQVSINVKALPNLNKPVNFSGAVGTYTLKSEIDNTTVKTNDAISLKITIRGEGNIELIDRIKVNFPPDFEVYDPKVTNRIITDPQNGVSGLRVFEYILIPRNPGDFIIPPAEFSFFDTRKKNYSTKVGPEYSIHVEKSEDYQPGITYSGINQEDIQYIGSDIRHIKTGQFDLQLIGNFFYASIWFYLSLIIPILIFVSFIIIWRKQAEKLSNQSLMRHKRATKVARRSLQKAQEFLGTSKSDEFYNEISQALWGYLSDKFSIPRADLSKETVSETLKGENIKEKSIEQFIETLNNCDYARFAPGDPSSTMDKIYNEALDIISKIEQELK